MAAAASRIATEIDFDKQGRQSAYLRAPLSRNTSGWGIIEIPIVVIKNGTGPTVLSRHGAGQGDHHARRQHSRCSQQHPPVAGR